MFDKSKFAQIIKNIKETYNSQEEFAKKSDIGRTYLSQYMNMKLEEPPKPKILEKLAISSHGITTYTELMEVCGYINDNYFTDLQYLQDKLKESESYYLNKLINYKMSSKEEKIYKDLQDIIPTYRFENYSNDDIDNELNSYFNNMDYINDKSKQKIINKLKLSIEGFLEMQKITNSIAELNYNHDKNFSDFTLEENNKTTLPKPNFSVKYFMTPVYRSHLSRYTKLGRRMYRRKNTY